MESNTVSYSSVTGLDPLSAPALWIQTQAPIVSSAYVTFDSPGDSGQMQYDSVTDLILVNGSVSEFANGTFATFDIPGDSLGQLNAIPSIDVSGNNSVLNGFTLFIPSESTAQGTIVKYLFGTRLTEFGTVPCVEVQSTAPITLTANKSLYIKYAKTAMNSALIIFLQHVASLTTQGMLPNTSPGFQNESYVNKNLLPSNITEGSTFTIGTTSITPVLKGVYNPAKSYTLGELVYYPDESGSLNICLIGPDTRGPSYSYIKGKELTSPYWNVISNPSWNTFTYDSLIDLAFNVTSISSNVIYCDSTTYPANLALQILPTALQGYSVFGSGINQLTSISSIGYTVTSNGTLYALTLNKVPSASENLYVKNALSNFLTLNTTAFTNYLSLNLTSANTILLDTTTQATSQGVASNSTSLTVISRAISTISEQYPTQTIGYTSAIVQQIQKCIDEYSTGLQMYDSDVSLGNTLRIPVTRNNLLAITSNILSVSSEVNNAISFIQISDSTNVAVSLSTITGYTQAIVATNLLL